MLILVCQDASPSALEALRVQLIHAFPEHRKNHLDLLVLMLTALLQAKDVRHAELAQRLPGNAKVSSQIRRVERFFDQHPLDQVDMARLVLTLLIDTKPRTFLLDRTFLSRTDARLGQSSAVDHA